MIINLVQKITKTKMKETKIDFKSITPTLIAVDNLKKRIVAINVEIARIKSGSPASGITVSTATDTTTQGDNGNANMGYLIV